jgi:2-polyprenyl-3-methyl-5-hydroxy-6-metoxy-1,4-benzoquinol methylase
VTTLDRIIQRWRIQVARKYIPRDATVLDIGSADGELLRLLGRASNVGIDPLVGKPGRHSFGLLIRGDFPNDLNDLAEAIRFDTITLLAVLEHIPSGKQAAFAQAIARYLTPGGTVVLSVPSPRVDAVLAVLHTLRLIHGMSLEQHYGFVAASTVPLFEAAGFRLTVHRKFEFGLNNVFVFTKAI